MAKNASYELRYILSYIGYCYNHSFRMTVGKSDEYVANELRIVYVRASSFIPVPLTTLT